MHSESDAGSAPVLRRWSEVEGKLLAVTGPLKRAAPTHSIATPLPAPLSQLIPKRALYFPNRIWYAPPYATYIVDPLSPMRLELKLPKFPAAAVT